MSEKLETFGETQKQIAELRRTVVELESRLEELTETVRCSLNKNDAQHLVMSRDIEALQKRQRPHRSTKDLGGLPGDD